VDFDTIDCHEDINGDGIAVHDTYRPLVDGAVELVKSVPSEQVLEEIRR
jgi:hypothetical protein